MYYSRKSPRIKNFDYSSENYYFITICTHNKECIFGKPNVLNAFGMIALEELSNISKHYTNVTIQYRVVMPNHIHAILEICGNNGANVNEIVGLYKSGVTRRIHALEPGLQIWQRSFHDHIIRDDAGYAKIAEYIKTNPDRWGEDCFYCEF